MRTAERMIEQEVLVCVSSLVSTLAGGYGSIENTERLHSRGREAQAALSELTGQAFELASPVLDHEEAAREAGWTESDAAATMSGYPVMGSDGAIRTSWEDACRSRGIDPHEREVFEHWAVTDWFAEKLEAAGEKVDRDFAGMCVWARTTTGQAIYMDAVIRRIHAECAKTVEG